MVSGGFGCAQPVLGEDLAEETWSKAGYRLVPDAEVGAGCGAGRGMHGPQEAGSGAGCDFTVLSALL